jgi:flagellar protein FliS
MYADSLFAPRRALPHGANAYRANAIAIQVAGADAHRLVTLLFEGFETAVAEAQGAMASGDVERKCAALTRAIRIIDEGLRAHLNLTAGGELARDLADLYTYVIGRLSLANLRNDVALLAECARLIKPLHEAWAAIGGHVRTAR